MSEQFAGSKFLGKGPAINGNKCFTAPPAAFVDLLGNRFLATTRFTINDYAVTGGRYERNLF